MLSVEGRRHQVVGGGNGMDVARQMEIEILHWNHLRQAAPGRPALDAEGRARLGWRMQVKTRFPKWAPSAWLRPIIVVDFPSPSGVGVMAVTSKTYLPLGRFASRSRTANLTLALVGTVEFEFGRLQADLFGDPCDRFDLGCLCDFNVGGDGPFQAEAGWGLNGNFLMVAFRFGAAALR